MKDFTRSLRWIVHYAVVVSVLSVNAHAITIEHLESEDHTKTDINGDMLSPELQFDNPIPEPKIKKIDFSDPEIQKILNEATRGQAVIEQQALIDISKKFVSSLQQRNITQFNETIDSDAIINKSLNGLLQLYDAEDTERGYILEGLKTIGGLLIRKIGQKGHVKFVQLVERQSDYRGLVRLKSQHGELTYLELHAGRDKDGQIKIIDYYDHMLGRNYTTSVNQLLVNLDQAKNSKKIISLNSTRASIKTQYTRSIRFYLKAEYKKALAAFVLLPIRFRNSRNNLLLRVQISKLISHNSYRDALTLLEQHFSFQPELGLLLADHYFFTKRYSAAMNSLEKFNVFIGGDIAVTSLLVKTHISNNNYAQAILVAQNAIAADNSYQDIYWLLLDALLQQYQYQQVGGVLDELMTRFDAKFDIKNFYKDPFYREYGFSKQFKKWQASRQINAAVIKVKSTVSDISDEQELFD